MRLHNIILSPVILVAPQNDPIIMMGISNSNQKIHHRSLRSNVKSLSLSLLKINSKYGETKIAMFLSKRSYQNLYQGLAAGKSTPNSRSFENADAKSLKKADSSFA
mmetsp:Transcript_2622/g.3301  ORF Transcript_2622/g.3301 Transcript_2622/m.3301 type:complete len:106 (+) Transcript_2622:74-391(+)